MTGSIRSSGSRLLAELIIVFLGVLVALGVDEWREGRVERERELEYLDALQADMIAATESLEAAIRDTEGWLEETDSFSAALRDTSIADGARLPSFHGAHPVVPTGTIDALLSTGDINLITDAALRATIIAESATLRDLFRQLTMWDEYALANMGAALRTGPRVAMAEGRSPLEAPSVGAVRRDPELVGIFRIHGNKYRNELDLFRALREATSRLHDSVSTALEAR